MTLKTDNLTWLGHDSVRFTGSQTIYFDPWEVSGPQAGLILITHDHFDHCDPDTVKALVGPKTKIMTDEASALKLKQAGLAANSIMALDPDDEIEAYGVNIKAVPAYNLDKDFHPKNQSHLGFVVTMDGLSVYHAGDTDFIPEMANIRAQVAFLPVSGTYVMTAAEAVLAALAIGPELAIPMHYGKIVGDIQMAEAFKQALENKIKVEIKTLGS